MNYKISRFNYDLTNAVDQEIECSGGFIYVLDTTDLTTVINIKTDTRQNDAIPLKKSYGIVARFSKFYLSAAAQPGKTITLIVTSSVDDFRIFEQAQNTDINTVAQVTKISEVVKVTDPVIISGITDPVTLTFPATMSIGNSSSSVTNPPADNSLLDVVVPATGIYNVTFSSDSNAGLSFNVCNNDYTLYKRLCYQFSPTPFTIKNLSAEYQKRFQIKTINAFTGTIKSNIYYERLT